MIFNSAWGELGFQAHTKAINSSQLPFIAQSLIANVVLRNYIFIKKKPRRFLKYLKWLKSFFSGLSPRQLELSVFLKVQDFNRSDTSEFPALPQILSLKLQKMLKAIITKML